MPNTYTLVASHTAPGGNGFFIFSNIPQTFTDLVLRISTRGTDAGGTNTVEYTKLQIVFNDSTTWGRMQVYGDGVNALVSIQANTDGVLIPLGGSQNETTTANTLCNFEMYIPNYTTSSAKQMSAFGVSENNGNPAFQALGAHYFGTSTAITTITIYNNFAYMTAGSTFNLYGIKNS